VRRTYPDDPDGGVFDGAEDAGWVRRFAPPRPSDRGGAGEITRSYGLSA
jgi:hypothetical protein